MSSSGGVAIINYILQCARKTFARSLVRPEEGMLRLVLPPDEFSQQLAHLRHMVSKVKASDVGLDRSSALHSEYVPYGRNRNTPVTYIGIYEDRDISVGIFIIRRGCRIPLHNHPGMHGIIKVVHGKVDIATYTKINPEQVETPDILQHRLNSLDTGRIFPVKKQLLQAGVSSGTLLLQPDESNLHELHASYDSSAAFLDILAPPYNQNDDDSDLRRDCDFYTEIKNVSFTIPEKDGDGSHLITWLQKEDDPPEDYYCDSEDFLGESLGDSNGL